MKASKLIKMYPDMWSNIKENIAHDLVAIKDLLCIPDESIDTIAHNATFRALEAHNAEVAGKPRTILYAPARYNLQMCLNELKYGRPAEDQLFLERCIKVLDGKTSSYSFIGGAMSFDSALVLMNENRWFSRLSWPATQVVFIVYGDVSDDGTPIQPRLVKKDTHPGNIASWLPCMDDIFGNDWYMVDKEDYLGQES